MDITKKDGTINTTKQKHTYKIQSYHLCTLRKYESFRERKEGSAIQRVSFTNHTQCLPPPFFLQVTAYFNSLYCVTS